MKRIYAWLDDRLGISSWLLPLLKHPVPRKSGWAYVFGSATLVAFIVQVVTGVALAFTYVPTPEDAYDSLVFITEEARLGYIVRGIHFWGSSAMVVLIVAHMIQSFLYGSYKYPRELNWLSGVALLGITLGLSFTGQLLRWDQDAYWAVVVAAEQARRTPLIGDWLVELIIAGDTVGGNTLTRFYATHVFLIPAVAFALLGIHLLLVVKHGVSEPPELDRPVDPKTYKQEYDRILHEDGVPFWPLSVFRDVVFALAVGAVVLLLSLVFGPKELGEVADPTNLEAFPRPDWYFLWLFALLALMPPSLEDILILGGPLVTAVLMIAVPFGRNTGDRHWRRRPWGVGAVVGGLFAIAVLTVLGARAPWSPVLDPGDLPQDVRARAERAGLTRGAELFVTSGCINCHAVGEVGADKGPELTHVGDRLTREQLVWRVLYGGEGMPPYGQTLSTEQTEALIDFLASLRASPGPEP